MPFRCNGNCVGVPKTCGMPRGMAWL